MDTPTNNRRQEEIDRRVAEQAAEWFTLLEDEDAPPQRAAFVEWIAQSPLHVTAFLKVTATERMLEGVDLRQWTSREEREPSTNVVSLGAVEKDKPHLTPSLSLPAGRRGRYWLAAAATLLTAGALWWLAPMLGGWSTYSTAIGEQRSVELTDGSVVHMNAQSRLKVKLSAKARELQLLEGEALFRVQRDPARPFRVHADQTVIQALGTQFNVDRRGERTAIAVIEGLVSVSGPADTTNTSERLAAGQGVNIVAGGTMERREAVNVEQVTAWRQRRLVFEEDTLADIAAEFNRYNRTPQIVIEDGPVRERRYAAVFDADDPESLLEFLRRDPALFLEARGDRLVVEGRK